MSPYQEYLGAAASGVTKGVVLAILVALIVALSVAWRKISGIRSSERHTENDMPEELYEVPLIELNTNDVVTKVWAKALADAGGNEEKARGLYLQRRAEQLLDEVMAPIREQERVEAEEEAEQEEARKRSRREWFGIWVIIFFGVAFVFFITANKG